ncbi:restriction endonuclease subunit S [Veillonella caviae]|uniref:restriction endonuclease subunit S n=1 Tax=Veillonella caviae TaxID=248316 RepID=UPI002A91E5DD|nr:restriction endonuclease subunit S [Veillonella caviae]MDY6224869.1 restriction endonuclease subunit S [Veillonella caviae]
MNIKLGDLGVINTGNTPSMKIEEFYSSNDIPFIKPDSFGDMFRLNPSCFLASVAEEKARIVEPGAILVTCIGTIGKVAITNAKIAFNQQINSISVNNNFDSEYIAYNILFNKFRLQSLSNSAVVPIINKSDFSKFEIKVEHNLEKQIKIKKWLNKVNQLKLLKEEQIRYLDLLIKSRFAELFGDPIKNEMDWIKSTLGELSSRISSGNTPKGGSNVYSDDGVMFIRSQNVWNNNLDLNDIVYISNDINDNMRETQLHYNDILITKTGRFNTENSSLGRSAIFKGESGSANINGHVYLVRLNQEIRAEFVLSILTSDVYRQLIRRVCVGGIDKRQLNKSHIEAFPIIIPPLILQDKYIQYIDQVNKLKFAIMVYN